jgi:hypothetical protein
MISSVLTRDQSEEAARILMPRTDAVSAKASSSPPAAEIAVD